MILINNLKAQNSKVQPMNTVKGTVSVDGLAVDNSLMATEAMIAQANLLGADAIVDVQYASTSAMSKNSKFIAFGTAVKFV